MALLAHPGLDAAAATDGLHAGIQLLLAGERAEPHRHTPSALRVGLEGSEVVTVVNDTELPLDPLDVVLNPSGTWHGHVERGGTDALWLDIVDLPLVSGLGGVLFEPSLDHRQGQLLDPPTMPDVVRYPWVDAEALLASAPEENGVRTHRYGGRAVLPTMAVTTYGLAAGASLELAPHTGGTVVLAARGRLTSAEHGPLDRFDVVALRAWTPLTVTSATDDGVVLTIDTTPALHALGLYRQAAHPSPHGGRR